MTPSIQLTVLRALREPMTLQGLQQVLPCGYDQLRHALAQARKMGRVEYQGTCSRDGVYVLTQEGRRYAKELKVCRTCKEEKPLSEFRSYGHLHWDGVRPDCKQCCSTKPRRSQIARLKASPHFQPDDGKRVLELMPRPQV